MIRFTFGQYTNPIAVEHLRSAYPLRNTNGLTAGETRVSFGRDDRPSMRATNESCPQDLYRRRVGRAVVSKTLKVIDPSTEQPIDTIALGSAADAEKTVAAARRAFASFSQTSNEERIELLKRIVAIHERRNDELGDIISREMGAPLAMARAEQAAIGAVISSGRSRPSRTFAFDYP